LSLNILLDENVPASVAKALRERGFNAYRPRDLGLAGANNILAELERSIKDRIQEDKEYSRLKDFENWQLAELEVF